MEYLSIEDIDVTGANAWNGIMIGVPAITAFMGAAHALQRKLSAWGCKFSGVAIGIKEYEMREYKSSKGHRCLNIPLQTETVKRKGVNVDAHIINQAYIDIKCNLIIEGNFDVIDNKSAFMLDVQKVFHTMRIAGGNIWRFKTRWMNEKDELPYGFYLKERTQEMMSYDGDNLLEKMMHALEDSSQRYVVLANGFRALTEPGRVEQQRDPEVPHVFAEQIYTCGEYIFFKDIKDISDYIFKYKQNDVGYLCTQNS